MTIKPLGNRVLIEPKKQAERTKSGIFIPETAKEDSNQGTVVEVGPLIKELKAGDGVIYSKFGGAEVKEDGKDYLLVELKDVLALIK